VIRDALSSIADFSRPASTTYAPAAPSRSAMARPMPLEAPVTTALRPVRSSSLEMRCSLYRVGSSYGSLTSVGNDTLRTRGPD
jgi:hypothetical protein